MELQALGHPAGLLNEEIKQPSAHKVGHHICQPSVRQGRIEFELERAIIQLVSEVREICGCILLDGSPYRQRRGSNFGAVLAAVLAAIYFPCLAGVVAVAAVPKQTADCVPIAWPGCSRRSGLVPSTLPR